MQSPQKTKHHLTLFPLLKIARRFDQTLIGFLRGRRFNIYSSAKRIKLNTRFPNETANLLRTPAPGPVQGGRARSRRQAPNPPSSIRSVSAWWCALSNARCTCSAVLGVLGEDSRPEEIRPRPRSVTLPGLGVCARPHRIDYRLPPFRARSPKSWTLKR